MDLTLLKNRLEDLEYKVKDLRFDFKLNKNSAYKLEVLRAELQTLEEDEKFFHKMKIIAILERDKFYKAELKMIKEAQINLNKENYDKLKKDPEYCKIIKELKICQQKYDIGAKYSRLSQKEQKKTIEKIHDMESRKVTYQ